MQGSTLMPGPIVQSFTFPCLGCKILGSFDVRGEQRLTMGNLELYLDKNQNLCYSLWDINIKWVKFKLG